MLRDARTAAFTLIEMLVVMAILATLSAIVVPMIFRSTEVADRLACTSNLKQIYQACQEYKALKQHYPRHDGKKFVAALYREGILEDARVLLCPSTDHENDEGEALGGMDSDPGSAVEATACSYAGRRNAKGSPHSLTAARQKNVPSTRIALACDGLVPVEDAWGFPHGDVVIVLFLDGHVEVLDVASALKGVKKVGEGATEPLHALGND